MAGIWLCADCHSANRDGAQRCYKCRTPRSSGEVREATAAMASVNAQRATAHLAAAARTGARYRPTWLLAAIFLALSILHTVVEYLLLATGLPLVSADGTVAASNSQLNQILVLFLWDVGASVAGTFVWAVWIALVVANVPALTAQWTNRTPLGAFMSVWIPFVSLKRPYTVVRSVLRILSDWRPGVRTIALTWWWTLLFATYGESFVIPIHARLSGGVESWQSVVFAGQVRVAFMIISAIFGGLVVIMIEQGQRRAARTRATIVRMAEQVPSTG